jgi:hypothetical protein
LLKFLFREAQPQRKEYPYQSEEQQRLGQAIEFVLAVNQRHKILPTKPRRIQQVKSRVEQPEPKDVVYHYRVRIVADVPQRLNGLKLCEKGCNLKA